MTDRVQYLYVDSNNRTEPYGNTYSLYLPEIIRGVYRVDLVSARVPNTIYNLSDGSNDLKVDGTTLKLPPGFYSAPTLSSYIQTATTAPSPFTVNYLQGEGKFIFFAGSSFTMNAMSTQMSSLIGLPLNTDVTSSIDPFYTSHPVYGGKHLIKSSNVINMSANEYLFLDIDELRTQYTLDTKPLTGNTFSGSTIAHSFAMIPMDIASGGIKCFKEHTDYVMSIWYPKRIDSLSRLTIRWLDKDNQVVSFNGAENNAFTLRIYSTM
jgi:hypothetical protein